MSFYAFLFSLGSPLCVLYKPNIVAAAALLLATHFSSTDKLSESWYEVLEDMDASEVHGNLKWEEKKKKSILML